MEYRANVQFEAKESDALLSPTEDTGRTGSARSGGSNTARLSKIRNKTQAFADISVLCKLKDIDYVEDHFPRLNASEVCNAAEMLDDAVVVSYGDGSVASKGLIIQTTSAALKEAIMFKNRAVKSCTLLHFAIWFVAEFGVTVELIQCVLDSLSDPDDVFTPGVYQVGRGDDKKDIFFSCVHLAAGLGQLEILQVLTNHAANCTSEERAMSPDQFVTLWAKIAKRREGEAAPTEEDYLDSMQDSRFTKFYQPIHDSSFQSYGDVTMWLLKQKAECTKNKDGITPLHFLAFAGISGGHQAKIGEDLREIVKALTETGRRGEGVQSLADMKNFIQGACSVTPLEVAVEDASRFPQDHLGLLAPCLSEGHHLSYFEDIKRIADVTAEGALNLVRTIAKSGIKHQHILRRFRINAQKPGSSDKFASICFTAPVAASEMLDLLNVEPEVEDPGRHGIPARTSMWGLIKNVPMRCTYQTETINKDNLMVPHWEWKTRNQKDRQDTSWHKDFLPRPPRQARGSDIKSVRAVTCLLPNILDIDIFRAIVSCEKEHLATMHSKTIQGAVFCLWGNLMEKMWLADVTYRAFEVVAYVQLAVVVPHDEARISLAWTIIAGGSLYQLVQLLSCMGNILGKWRKAKAVRDGETLKLMWSPGSNWALSYFIPGFCGVATCLVYAIDLGFKTGERDKFDDRLLAICLLLACCRFVWAWRMSNIGATIYTIAETCLAAAVNQVLFITCMLLFSVILALMVLSRFHTVGLAVSAYRGFMFGDDYGFHDLGMDIGHESAFAGSDGVLLFASVMGAFFFNVIVLNIIIAIYGHEYEKNQINTPSLFMIGRADYCVKTVLSSYIIPWKDEARNRMLTAGSIFLLLSGVFLGALTDQHLIRHIGMWLQWLSAALFAMGLTFLRMALIQCDWYSPEGADSHGDYRFLWIANSPDWQPIEDEDTKLEESVENLHENMHEEIGEVKHQIKDLEEKIMDLTRFMQTQRMVAKTTKSVDAPTGSKSSKTLDQVSD